MIVIYTNARASNGELHVNYENRYASNAKFFVAAGGASLVSSSVGVN